MGWIRLGRSFYPQLGICHVHSGCSGQQGSGTPQVRTTNSTTAYCKPIWREVNVISLHNWDKQSVILFCIVDVVTPVQLFTLCLSKSIMTAVLREVFFILFFYSCMPYFWSYVAGGTSRSLKTTQNQEKLCCLLFIETVIVCSFANQTGPWILPCMRNKHCFTLFL